MSRARVSVLLAILSSSFITIAACGDSELPPIGALEETPDGGGETGAGDAAAGDGNATADAVEDVTVDSTIDVENDAPNDATDAGADTTLDATDAAADVTDAQADALDATSDVRDASADVVDAGDAADAAPPVAEKVSPAMCPWAVTVKGGQVFWTEPAYGGCATAAVRSCSVAGCSTLPPSLYSATGQLPLGIVAVSATGPLFYTDNQGPNDGLFRLEHDGGRTNWSEELNGAGAATDGTYVYWGSGQGLYRVDIAAPPTSAVAISGNLAGSVDNGPHTVTVDDANVYGAVDVNQIRACPLGQVCTGDGGATLIGTALLSDGGAAQVGGIASDGVNVYFTSGMAFYNSTGPERLSRCPITGCAAGGPELMHERTTTNGNATSSHFGVAVDAKNVYFGTVAGSIEYCPKTAAAPCTPTVLVADARPFGFAIDGPYLYWADRRGAAPGIYRIQRP